MTLSVLLRLLAPSPVLPIPVTNGCTILSVGLQVCLQTCRFGSSGKLVESVLCKVSVICKSVLDDILLHQGEGGTVGKAVGFVLVSFEDLPSSRFIFHVDP